MGSRLLDSQLEQEGVALNALERYELAYRCEYHDDELYDATLCDPTLDQPLLAKMTADVLAQGGAEDVAEAAELLRTTLSGLPSRCTWCERHIIGSD
jgi:hypothetical protein